MRDVAIIGVGQTKVGEHWDVSLRHLALEALQAALADAGVAQADALYVGNMLSGELTGQENLGALITDFAGLRGIESFKVEAGCASGAAAMRMGYVAVEHAEIGSSIEIDVKGKPVPATVVELPFYKRER